MSANDTELADGRPPRGTGTCLVKGLHRVLKRCGVAAIGAVLASATAGSAGQDAYVAPAVPTPRDYLFLADGGRTAYVIYHEADAPSSVRDAAREFQRVLRAATGVTMPIQNIPARPMICLGDNPSARGAGLAGEALPYEGYRIVAQAGDLYIVGRDTRDGETTPWSGVSRGTQFGVHTFLERYLGVRWLMPGELGEEIPQQAALALAPMDVTESPDFACRTLSLDAPPDAVEWGLRHKISIRDGYAKTAGSFGVSTGPHWTRLLPAELRDRHPAGAAVDGDPDKFCTRHPALVATLATNAMQWLRAHPGRHMVSVSPPAGQRFCRCDRCRPLIATDPHGKDAFTRALLDLYNDVARRLAAVTPDAMVGGLASGPAAYPPAVATGLEPNVFIDWRPRLDEGPGLYTAEALHEFQRVAAAWRAITPNIGYGRPGSRQPTDSAAPRAPAPSILKQQFPVLKQLGYRAVSEVGTSQWAGGALNNYLLAKLLWNARADVDALYTEWLEAAYGASAGAMRSIYELLDAGFREFADTRYDGGTQDIAAARIEAIYLPALDRIETLYLRALNTTTGDRARRRIELFGAHMVGFHVHLRRAGYLDAPRRSLFYRSDEDYAAFLARAEPAWLAARLRRLQPLPPRGDYVPFVPRTRTLTVPRIPAGRTITLDGRVTAAEWAAAAVVSDFRRTGVNLPAHPATTVRVVRDSHTLYLAFECEEPRLEDIEVRERLPDSLHILDGNTVQVLLKTSAAVDWSWLFAVSPANSRWEGRSTPRFETPDPAEDPAWKSAASLQAGQWSVELAIPLTSLDVRDRADMTWRVNLGRTRSVAGLWQTSTWNPVKRSLRETEHCGEWQFESPWKAIR